MQPSTIMRLPGDEAIDQCCIKQQHRAANDRDRVPIDWTPSMRKTKMKPQIKLDSHNKE